MTAYNTEQRALMEEIGQAVAEAMGKEWTFRYEPSIHWGPEYGLFLIEGEGGRKVYIDLAKNRVVVSGEYPRRSGAGSFIPNNETPPVISCDVKRGPRVIANDVMNRFLQAYLSLFWKAEVEARRYDAQEANRKAVVDRILATGHFRADRSTEHRLYGSQEAGGVTIDVYASGDIQMKGLSCSLDKALRIIAILAEPRATETGSSHPETHAVAEHARA